MSTGYCRVILIGNLTRDPELRYTGQGTAVSDLRVAVTTRRGGRNTEAKDETLFIDVTVWDRLAEFVNEWFSKGKPILVEGRLVEDSWQDKETGEKRAKVKILADRVQFLPRSDAGGGAQGGGGYVQRAPAGDGDMSAAPTTASSRRPSSAQSSGGASRSGPDGASGRGAPAARPQRAESFDDDFSAGAPPAEDIPF